MSSRFLSAGNMITSIKNPKIQWIRHLISSRQYREKEGAFVIEGVRLTEEAIANNWEFKYVVYSDEISERGRQLIQRLIKADISVEEIAPNLLRQVSTTETPQGILSIVKLQPLPVPAEPDFCLILDGIRDPGNLGTILRTAAAMGVEMVFLVRGSVDIYSPKVVRSAMGAHFRIPVREVEWKEIKPLLSGRERQPISLYRSDVRSGKSLWEMDFRQPVALIIGSEATGVSEGAIGYADDVIHIPMPGGIESLNASVAAAILMYEVIRQRKTTGNH